MDEDDGTREEPGPRLQDKWEFLCREYNITDCYVQVNELSKKKLKKKIKELIARCKWEQEQRDADDADAGDDPDQPEDPGHKDLPPDNDGNNDHRQGEPDDDDNILNGLGFDEPVPAAGGGDFGTTISPDSNTGQTGKHLQPELEEEDDQAHDEDEDVEKNRIPDTVYADTTDDSPATSEDQNCDRDEIKDEDYFMRKYNIDPEWPLVIMDRLDPVYIDWMVNGQREKPADGDEDEDEEEDESSTSRKRKKGKKSKSKAAVKVKKEKKEPAARKKGRPAAKNNHQVIVKEDEYTPESDPEYTEDPEAMDIADPDFDALADGPPSASDDDDVQGDEDFIPEGPKSTKRGRKAAGSGGSSEKPVSERRYRPKTMIKMHHCDVCSFSTTNVKDLKNHVTKHELGMDPMFTCDPCNVQFFSRFDHDVHQYEQHDGPAKLPRVVILHCKSCKLDFDGIHEFDFHIINHIRAVHDGFQCTHEKCSFVSAKFTSASDHVKTHTLYKCTFCDKVMQKMEQLQTHCNREHKQFGLPFRCDLCEFRTSVFGLLVNHKEEIHGVSFDKDVEICRFCGSEPRVVFTTTEDKMIHLAIHADFTDRLYKCVHMDCDFTADHVDAFSDHNLLNHISDVVDDEISYGLDKAGLVEAISVAVRKQFRKQAIVERTKPNSQETDCAVNSLLGFLNEETDENPASESDGFCVTSGDAELDSAFQDATPHHSEMIHMNGDVSMMDISELPLFDSS